MNAQQVERIAWGVGGLGLIGAAIGWLVQPAIFAGAWLAAMTAWLGWPLGCLALLLVHALTGGRWGEPIRRQLLAGTTTIILLPLIAVPFICVSPRLYPWLHHDVSAALNNGRYLNLPFFLIRGLLYLTIWIGLAGLVLRAARRHRSLQRLAPPGLILLAFSVTFAAIDTTMSLDPQFNSSAYGMLVAAADGLFALSIVVLGAALAGPQDRGVLDDLGRLLIGLTVLSAYLDFMQLLIVWQSNLASDAPWYVRRLTGGWAGLAGVVAVGHFLLPFFVLLTPTLRRRSGSIAAVCLALIVAEILRNWWLVLPAVSARLTWWDVVTMLGVAGVAVAVAARAASYPLLQGTEAHNG